MKCDLVIFDCDGVVVDTETSALAVLHQMIVEKKVPIEPTEVFIENSRGKKIATILETVSKQHSVEFPENFIGEFRARSLEAFEKDITPIDGIEIVLKELKVPFCMGSNSPLELIESCLSLTGLLHHFKGKIFSAYQLNSWKPDPYLFKFAADTMGVPHERCIVVEDSLCGVQAALAASMFPLGYVCVDEIPSKRHTALKNEGAIIISDMREVLNFAV
ncbi:MAG: HAD family hydrolase [Proteobacteria bacterium]|nr:HAD family hydrolase [Pseudomonadota bacterium]